MGCPTECVLGDNLTFSVTTHTPSTGASTDDDSVPTYRIYEDETATPILTGSMAKLDDANTLGFYTEEIACTTGNGFEDGKSYTIYIEATVGGVQGAISYGFKTPTHVWDEVLTGATHNIATSSGRRLRQVEAITVLSSGDAQGGTASTIQLAAGENASDDFYDHTMVVIVAGPGIGQSRAVQTYTGGNKTCAIVPDWVTNPTSDSEYLMLADTLKHVFELETGAILAASFVADAINAAALATDAVDEIADGVADEVLTAGNHNVTNSLGKRIRLIDEEVGYQEGAIWLDTINGTPGQDVGENGTVSVPSSNITDAIALAVATGRVRIRVASGSTVTLVAALEGYEIYNANWTLALGGQSISGSCITGATVSGIATGASAPRFIDCRFNTVILPPCLVKRTGFAVKITAGSAGTFTFDNCYSAVAGTGAPIFDFGSGLNASNLNLRHYSGGKEIENMGVGLGSYNMSIEGDGQIIANANCTGGTVAVRGHFPKEDNSTGAGITWSEDARYDVEQISDAAWDKAATDHVTAGSMGKYMTDMRAFARGKVTISGDNLTFFAADDVSELFTLALTTAGRTVT